MIHLLGYYTKTIFLFPKYYEKMVYQKKLPWNMIFLLLSRKMIFSRKYDLVLWTENGRSSLSKDTTEDYIFCKCSEKMNFQKTALECDLSCIIRKDDIFFEHMILFLRQERKDDLSQKNIWKYDIFFKCSENLVFSKNCIGI